MCVIGSTNQCTCTCDPCTCTCIFPTTLYPLAHVSGGVYCAVELDEYGRFERKARTLPVPAEPAITWDQVTHQPHAHMIRIYSEQNPYISVTFPYTFCSTADPVHIC